MQHRQPHCSVWPWFFASLGEGGSYLPDPGGNITVVESLSVSWIQCALLHDIQAAGRENVLKQYLR